MEVFVMKKLSGYIRLLSVLGLLLTTFLVLPNNVSAAWFTVHGHTGNVEYMSRLNNADIYKGWGLSLDLKSSNFNWVHFSIPTALISTTRYVAFELQTGSVDIWIDEVHIWNGKTKIKTFNNLTWSGIADVYILDLGSQMSVGYGLGISVKIIAGVESMNHRVSFYTVAADLF
jgi:hypothetical protein